MKSPKTKTLKPAKACRMWANPVDFGDESMHLTSHRDPSYDRGNVLPVAVIPLDDVEALIEKAFHAYMNGSGMTMKESVCDALTAIGVLPKKRKGRK